jgi:hypothetical protein
MNKILVIICILAGSIPAALAVENTDFQSWNNISIFGNFGAIDPEYSKFRYELTYQQRLADSASTSFQTLYRGGLGYNLNSRHSLWLGADYLITRNLVPEEVNTSGVWQQYLYENNYNELRYFVRSRLEELIISNANNLVLRARIMVRGSHPISENKCWNIIGFNEYFQNLNGTGVIENASLIQNRAFAGLGYGLNKNTNLEVGYMNQYIHNSQGFDSLNNIVLASLVLNFN